MPDINNVKNNDHAKKKEKGVVLEEIAKAFELERIYSEREVNIIIADFHDDFCTLRRDMISEGLLERENGAYYLKLNLRVGFSKR